MPWAVVLDKFVYYMLKFKLRMRIFRNPLWHEDLFITAYDL